ncbi:hypothetical protein GWO13_06950 [Candidatus Bathyarchaeota archaeon]|nr:hypothetical protein [Candidatus Bathyarchaeota archaeon]
MRKKLLWITLIIPLILSLLNVNMIGVAAAQETHDIAVISVTPYPTKVGLGELVNVTVIIENQGTENENFTVTVYYDNTTIETQNVTDQAPNTNTTLTFTWNTTGIMAETYSINATASAVPNETETADNTLISPSKVKVVSPYIIVLPRRTVDITLTPVQNYTVSIYTNYNGSDIWGYEFILTYNPLVLHGVEVVNGDLITDGDTLIFSAGEFNNTEGRLSLTKAVGLDTTDFPPVPVTSKGPGVLANVTFTIVGKGESPITLGSETRLIRGDGTNIIDDLTDLNPDPTKGKFLHGSFQNVQEVIHDVAVISVDPSPTLVEEGELVTINVTIRNKGTTTARVSVEVYYGFDPTTGIPLNLIEKETVTLESGVNETLTFTWNTTNVDAGTYPIVAVAELLGGVTDINPDDNMLPIDDAVEVTAFRGTPWPIWQIVSIVVVIVVVAVAIYIVRRKRRK